MVTNDLRGAEMRYVRFIFSAGYAGTATEEVAAFDADASDELVEECFQEWYENQRRDDGGWVPIPQDEADEIGVDVEY